MDVMFTDTGVEEYGDNVVAFQGGLRAAGANEVTPGRRCSECGNYAMIKRDGCDFCTACGAQGGCG
jgi:ribonucleoside-diphosphate reductase alpha chain